MFIAILWRCLKDEFVVYLDSHRNIEQILTFIKGLFAFVCSKCRSFVFQIEQFFFIYTDLPYRKIRVGNSDIGNGKPREPKNIRIKHGSISFDEMHQYF